MSRADPIATWLGLLGFGDDFKYSGWGFNTAAGDGYYLCDRDNPNQCAMIPPSLVNSRNSAELKSKPFFAKNPRHNLYMDQSVTTLTPAVQEELLANDIPALTFAAGHRGVGRIYSDESRNIDIRKKYAVNKPWWPRGTEKYEWRHADVYRIAYPYLFELYDAWKNRIEGDLP